MRLELTENTTSTANRMVLLAGNPRDKISAMEAKIAVMLSAIDENIKLKIAVKKVIYAR